MDPMPSLCKNSTKFQSYIQNAIRQPLVHLVITPIGTLRWLVQQDLWAPFDFLAQLWFCWLVLSGTSLFL